MENIVLAGGCFWGMQDLFRQEPGVIDTEVGYAGGQNDKPTYDFHPGHAEAIKNPTTHNLLAIKNFSTSFLEFMTQQQKTGRVTMLVALTVLPFSTRTLNS